MTICCLEAPLNIYSGIQDSGHFIANINNIARTITVKAVFHLFLQI